MKRTHLLPIIVIIAVLLLLTGRYLLNGVPHEFMTGEYKGTFEGDYDFTLELVDSLKSWGKLPLWSETYSGPIAVFASNFHVFEQGALYFLTRDLAVSIKILQVLQLFIAGLGMYLLSFYLFKDKVSAVFSAVIYMLTPFYLGHLLSYLHYTGVYMLAPLVYLLMLKSIQDEGFRNTLLLCLVMTYSVLSHPQNAFIGGIFYSLFFVLVSAHELLRASRKGTFSLTFKRLLITVLVISTVTFLLSAFIVLPTLVHNYPYLRASWVETAKELVKVDTGHIGSHSQSLLYAISLLHWPWSQTPLIGGALLPWYYMATYLIPFALASLSILIRCNWITFVFLIMTVLSVQISLGVKGEPDIFSFASKYVPFFGMSRTPYTYINHGILTFCLLSSVTFSWIIERVSTFFAGKEAHENRGTKLKWVLLALFITPYLFAARFYATNYNWTLIPAKQPRYLSQVWGWMDKNNKDRSRVIETCGIPTAMLLGQRMLPNGVDLLERFHKKEYLDRLLSLLGFRYIITPTLHSQRSKTFDRKGYIPPSVFERNDGMEQYYSALTTEYYFIYERLKKDPNFKLHRAGTRDVAIFENDSAFKDYELYPAIPVMVLGGVDAYDFLTLDRFRYGDIEVAPVFIAQSKNLKRIDEIKSVSKELVLHNTDALDLFILLNRERVKIFQPMPEKPDHWETAIQAFGIQQPFPQLDHSIGNSLFGEVTFSELAITSRKAGAEVEGTFEVEKDGVYRVLLRSYGGGDFSDASVDIDGKHVRTINHREFSGYRWSTLWQGRFEKGAHRVGVKVMEDRPVYIDSIAVLDLSTADNYLNNIEKPGELPLTYIMNHRRFTLSRGEARSVVHTKGSGPFIPSIRLARFEGISSEGAVKVLIDGRTIGEVSYSSLDEKTREFKLPVTKLGPGKHTVTISGFTEGMFFNLFSLSPVETQLLSPEVLFDYEKKGPSVYRVEFSSPEKLFMVLNETNYPGWKMNLNGEVKEPVVTNMFMNGFIVPAGSSSADVYYSNRVQRTGVWLSSSTFFLVLGFLFVERLYGTRRGRIKPTDD